MSNSIIYTVPSIKRFNNENENFLTTIYAVTLLFPAVNYLFYKLINNS